MDVLCGRIHMPELQNSQDVYNRPAGRPEGPEALLNSLPGGVVKVRLDMEQVLCTVEYVSQGVYALTGFSPEECRQYQETEQNIIAEDEFKPLWETAVAQAASGAISSEFSIRCKDGKTVWVLAQGKVLSAENEVYTVLFLLTDITVQKQEQCRLETERERYRIVADISDDYLFEYDTVADTMAYSEKEPVNLVLTDAKDFLKVFQLKAHGEDSRIIQEIYENLRKGSSFYSAKFRAQSADGTVRWYSVCFTTIFDTGGVPLRSVGKITDIDELKKENDKLKEKAQRDSLTKLTNKMTTRKLVTQCLEKDPDSVHALLMIDIDNFKTINDTLGHQIGDKVLVEIASKFQTLFRSTDVVGRIGGDEFLVMLRGLQCETLAEEKARAICTICRELKFEGRQVTGSVGVAMYPADGKDFDTLYHNADVALYEAKKWGKNTYFRYGEYNEQQMLFEG